MANTEFTAETAQCATVVLGALASLDIARRHPHTFAGILAMSPSLTWSDQSLSHDIDRDPAGLSTTRIWLDMGAQELGPENDAANQRLLAAARDLDISLAKHHIPHHLQLDPDHPSHNEPAWAARFPKAITYLLTPDPQSPK